MRQAAKDLEFEKAAQWRDELGRLRQEWADRFGSQARDKMRAMKKKPRRHR